jgi:hypothetical protein
MSSPADAQPAKIKQHLAEVASVWAEQAHRLGYLTVDRLLDADEWTSLAPDHLRERFDGKDVRRSDVEAEYGAPSLVADNRTLCYAPADGTGWIFMDCYSEPAGFRYVPGKGTYGAQLVSAMSSAPLLCSCAASKQWIHHSRSSRPAANPTENPDRRVASGCARRCCDASPPSRPQPTGVSHDRRRSPPVRPPPTR